MSLWASQKQLFGKGFAMTYDDWKLQTPPETERAEACPGCGNAESDFEGDYCDACGWTSDDVPEVDRDEEHD